MKVNCECQGQKRIYAISLETISLVPYHSLENGEWTDYVNTKTIKLYSSFWDKQITMNPFVNLALKPIWNWKTKIDNR